MRLEPHTPRFWCHLEADVPIVLCTFIGVKPVELNSPATRLDSSSKGRNMRLPIEKQREIVRQIASANLSNRVIGNLCKVSPTTVEVLRTHFVQSRKTWSFLATLTDTLFSEHLGTKLRPSRKGKTAPDWSRIHAELQKRDITLSLLHVEYLAQLEVQPEQAMGYSHFASEYRAWCKTQRISMRQFHRPGEKLFIDFCGRTMPVWHQSTGEVIQAQIFVAVLGASGYVFAYAVPSQKTADWLLCHTKAFTYFGGVPKQLVPDNLKAAVTKHTRDVLVLNRQYTELADHYQCVINPTRVRKPKDKSLAEVSVQIVQRWVLAPLRHQKFFDIETLNEAIAERVSWMNMKTSKKYPMSRAARFEALDQPHLTLLPDLPYKHSKWCYNVRVPMDYHVEFEFSHYSVPHAYVQHIVDIRASSATLEVLIAGQSIASHALLRTPGISTHDFHRPMAHSQQNQDEPEQLQAWATQLGPSADEWVRRNLLRRRIFANGLKAVKKLRRWVREQNNSDRIDSACEFALKFDQLGLTQLKSIVERNADKRHEIDTTAWVKTHQNIRGAAYFSAKNLGESAC